MYINSAVCAWNVDFSDWNFGVHDQMTLREQHEDIAKFMLGEIWGSIQMQIEISPDGLGTIVATSKVDDTFAYFPLAAMVRFAVYEIATDYGEKFREEHVEETRQRLLTMGLMFNRLAEEFLEAAKDPVAAAKNRPSGNPLDYFDRETVEALKEMCHGREFDPSAMACDYIGGKDPTIGRGELEGMAKNDDWSPQDERIAMAAMAFASDHGPIPAARKGDVGAKTIVASLLRAQLAARGLKIVDDI